MTRMIGIWLFVWMAAILAAAEEKTLNKTQPPGEAADVQAFHRQMSVSCFNQCWTLIDKADRTVEDTENMIGLAHASLWHWKQRTDVKPLNLSIGYWQVSRVHALAGQVDAARFFAERCRTVSAQDKLPPFYLGYAYEALARAEMAGKDFPKAAEFLNKAREQLGAVTDPEERKLLGDDLDGIGAALPKP